MPAADWIHGQKVQDSSEVFHSSQEAWTDDFLAIGLVVCIFQLNVKCHLPTLAKWMNLVHGLYMEYPVYDEGTVDWRHHLEKLLLLSLLCMEGTEIALW